MKNEPPPYRIATKPWHTPTLKTYCVMATYPHATVRIRWPNGWKMPPQWVLSWMMAPCMTLAALLNWWRSK